MPTTRRIFLSMVSDEFRPYRELLTKDLERAGVVVDTQEKWGVVNGTTLDKLDTHLRTCDAVIHIVGNALGHVPPPASVDALLARHPGLLAHFNPDIGLTHARLAACSYTQWEAYLTLFHGRGLYLYRPAAAAAAAGDSPMPPVPLAQAGGDHPQQHALQAEHWQRLCALGQDRGVFLNAERLSSHVLGDLNSLLPPRAGGAVRASIPRLPHTPRTLIGREPWLAQLDAAWDDPHQHGVIVRAWGGTGKTALVTTWMAEMAVKGWRGAEAVFYWSFYTQGTSGEGQAKVSADVFIAKALAFFDDPDPTAGSAWERGARLAHLVGASKALLVLDGLEPLQHPPGPLAGQLTDPAVIALLGGLAAHNAGLCVVTSRELIPDLDGRKTVATWGLDKLSDDAGAALLYDQGVTRAGPVRIAPDAPELQAACREVAGHALTLTLMAKYLALACDGDIRQRDTFRFADADRQWVTTPDPDSPYGHAFKVMAAYERWFLAKPMAWWQRWLGAFRKPVANAAANGGVQLAILRALGLFNRPASADCLNALLQPPAIQHLSEPLRGITAQDWKIAVQRLADAGLLTTVHTASAGVVPHSIDAHPLIREYFGQQLRSRQPQAFQAAHGRLFDHLCQSTPHRPDTLDGLQPLYQAVGHGCLAGRQQEACREVYVDRILRGTGDGGNYSTFKLGAMGSDLGAVAAFFEQIWTRVSANLSEGDQAWLLNEAAVSLCALGRLTEALEPMRAGLEKLIRQADWENASANASNLSDLEVTLGRLGEAVADARRAIDFADRSGDAFQQMSKRSTAADALHQSGEPGPHDEARALFATAEAMQHQRQPEFERLYSLRGFRYCDLILAPAERAAWAAALGGGSGAQRVEVADALADAERRGTQTLKWAIQFKASLLDIALNHLTLARVALYRAALASTPPAANTNPHLAPALDGLRQAGALNHLPKALLTAAHWQALAGDAAAARRHLDEAQQIAERGPMPLYLADVHLHRARLFRDKAALALAQTLIKQHGYGRRHEELGHALLAAQAW